jgi:predicted O-methyltransferase YrrM
MIDWQARGEQVKTFVDATMSRETEVARALRAETAKMPMAGMQSRQEQASFLQFMVRLIGARRVIEVGVFTGGGTLAMALALPPEGRVVACDVSAEWTSVGRRHWEKAGVANKIDLRLAPAGETLAALLAEGGAGAYDMAFIDADKTGYDGYYETCLKLVRKGGLIVLDNMLWSGRVADPGHHDPDTDALRALNLKIRDDARVDWSLLAADDGIMLARVR